MSKTLRKGIHGRYGIDGLPAVTVGVDGSNVILRVLARNPDDDATVTDEPGYAPIGPPAQVADVLGASKFVASHPVVIFCDTEDNLTPYVPDLANLLDVEFKVRNASKSGWKSFMVAGDDETQTFIPLQSPTVTIDGPAPSAFVVAAGTDVVLGSPGVLASMDVQYSFPGGDTSSPFAGLWAYADGVLLSLPTARLRIATHLVAAELEPAKWQVVAQTSVSAGPWNDAVLLAEREILGLLTASDTVNGLAEITVSANTQLRIIIRHDDGGPKNVTISRGTVFVNALAAT
jgi:hypothetical protein